MLRILFAGVCLLSLLLGSAVALVTAHSRRTWHTVVWRTDAAAEAERAHTSLSAVWREFRERGELPGMRDGRRVRAVVAQAVPPASSLPVGTPAPRKAVAREYASLVLADGVVEYRRYPEPPCMVLM